MLIGIIILGIFAFLIIKLRQQIYASDNTALKTVTKVGDFFIWLRFIFFIIFFGGIILVGKSR